MKRWLIFSLILFAFSGISPVSATTVGDLPFVGVPPTPDTEPWNYSQFGWPLSAVDCIYFGEITKNVAEQAGWSDGWWSPEAFKRPTLSSFVKPPGGGVGDYSFVNSPFGGVYGGGGACQPFTTRAGLFHWDGSVWTNITPHPTSKRPVVIIPGIMGTVLERKDTQAISWISFNFLTDTPEPAWQFFPLFLQANGISPDTRNRCTVNYNNTCDTNNPCATNECVLAGSGPGGAYGKCSISHDSCGISTSCTINQCTTGGTAITPSGPLVIGGDNIGLGFGWPGYRAYNSLKDFLVKNNYTTYIYPYDWRLDLDTEADKFKAYLEGSSPNGLALKPLEQIDVVAHSMGGLLVRTYLKKYLNDNRIASVIYLSTPQRGSPMAYAKLIGAASLSEKFVKYFEINTHKDPLGALIPFSLESNLAQNFPGVYDLLPQDPFIKINVTSNYDGTFENLDSTSYQSSRLPNNTLVTNARDLHKNKLAVPSVVPRSFAINGSGKLTLAMFDFTSYPKKIRGFNYGSGDGTVPNISLSWYLPSSISYVNEYHKDLPSNGAVQQKILNILGNNGKDNDAVTGIQTDKPFSTKDNWGWSSGSPILTHITDEDGNTNGIDNTGNLHEGIPDSNHFKFTENEGGFFPFEKTYSVSVDATANGLFTLGFDHLGSPDNNVLDSIVYTDIPISSKSHAQLALSPTDPAPSLQLDVNGDNVVDFVIPPNMPAVAANIFPAVLTNVVQNFGLPKAISKTLLAELAAISESIKRGKINVAKVLLRVFIIEVKILQGKALTVTQANTLNTLASEALLAL